MNNEDIYFEWMNNFLSVNYMAEYYGIPEKKLCIMINKGRILHECNFGSIIEFIY